MDVDREWEYDVTASASKSRNSPFAGWRLKGKATATIANGVLAWAERN
jgi:dihydroorotase